MKKYLVIGAVIVVILAAIAPDKAEVVVDFLWQAGQNIVRLVQS
jgi:hypothetical protein